MTVKGITFKKRYLVLALIVLEVASIPVSATILDKVAFSKPQRVVSVPFPPEAGLTRFLVSSNAPFAVISENAIGEFDVSIKISGILNGKRFGSNAQMPGAATTCAVQNSTRSTKIYEAERKITAQDGDILTQAIILEIRYDAETRPNFKIISQNKAKRISAGLACETKLS